jgi:c-di-GMP-binding flagellar brake protein YcgR
MKQTELALQIGDRLQLQKSPADRPERYVVEVVGVMPAQSVIVSTPRVNGKVAIVRQDTKYAVRVLQGSSVFGFVSSVLQSYSVPFPHLHLSFPRELESIVVRNALRAATDLSGVVRNTKLPDSHESYRRVRLVDLSNSGARLVSQGSLGQENDMLILKFALAVCGCEENVGLVAQIRSMGKRAGEEDQPSFWTGVQFQALSRFQTLVLHAFVLERFLGEGTGG